MTEDFDEAPDHRRPVWITVVAAILVIGLVWAAVPRFLWPWVLAAAFVGFLLWRAAAPRSPDR
jgi:hypothetical protein